MDIILYGLMGICVLLVGGLIIWGVYAIIVAIYRKTLRYETFPSTARVCSKKYVKPYTTTTMMMVGKTTVPQIHHHDEEYNVYLTYNGEEYYFDNEELYNSANVGDKVRVLVHEGYNKCNKVKHVYLSIQD